jgi:hypothetical protein
VEEENPFGENLLPPQEPAPSSVVQAAGGEPVSGSFGMDELLPDLDAMAGAFGSSDGVVEVEAEEQPAVRKPSVGGKPSKLEGDFDPKEIAAAIRTRLKKE